MPNNTGRPPKGARAPMKFDKKVIKRVFQYIKPYTPQMIIVVVCIIVTAVASVGSSLFLGTLIDDHITPMVTSSKAGGAVEYSGLLGTLIKMGCLFLGGAVAALLNARIMAGVSQGVLKKIREDMFEHMQTLPISYFDTHQHGEVMSFYTNDIDAMEQMISQSIPQVLSSGITLISVFFSMLSISVWLTLVVILFLVFMLMITAKLAGKSGKFFVKQQGSLAKINGYIEEMINGQRVVKIFCREEKSKETFDVKNSDLCENTCAANAYANILMPVNNALGYFLYVILAIIGGAFAINKAPNIACFSVGTLLLGDIASFLLLSRSFIGPIGQVSQQLNAVVMALAGAERIFSLIDEKPETDDGFVTLVNAKKDADGNITECEEKTDLRAWKIPSDTGITTYVEHKGDIVLDDVDFGYVPEKIVLHDIDIFAQPGQKVAFVGATGAGKTTITNLINRFYDIDDGKIRYDGININKIKKADLRRSLGVVLQDVNLFTGTIMDNLRYGRPDATDEDCIAAAKLANADNFIRMLPDGYQTVLHGSGSSLSQGQRQLLSIARAAVADPPVMILDEATSSIDTRTESIVQAGMDALMKGRTVFVIAHRLSTVRNSDVIMVLDHGHIIERGSHEKLIAEKGQYYRLYTGAFELE